MSADPPIQRLPPHSNEAEQAVLSSIMAQARWDPGKLDDLILTTQERIEPTHFFNPVNRRIFEVLIQMYDRNKPLGLIEVTQELRDCNLLDSLGGPSYITTLYDAVSSGANIEYYLGIVRDKHILREIIASATEAIRRAYEEQDCLWSEEQDGEVISGVLEEYQTTAIEIGRLAKAASTAKPLAAFIPPALKAIEKTYHNRGDCTGISTGFVDLDRIMNGFEAPLTYYFAARPAMGKSALMLAFAQEIAINAMEQKKRIKIFSLEMTGEMLAKRMICSRANIKVKALRHGFMDDQAMDHWENGVLVPGRATEAAKQLTTDSILIDEKGDLSIMEFRSRARSAVLQEKCDLIMVDYLQRMRGSGKKRNRDSRELEISEIAQGISATAKELNVPIVVLAQLNRKAEDRWDGMPELGDLRESGSLEQEARFVGLLWRPWYYAKSGSRKEKMIKNLQKQWEKTDFDDPDIYEQFAVCIVAKQNEGPVGPVPLRFLKDFARYEAEATERALWSNRPQERQEKPADHDFLASLKEVFPNASPCSGS